MSSLFHRKTTHSQQQPHDELVTSASGASNSSPSPVGLGSIEEQEPFDLESQPLLVESSSGSSSSEYEDDSTSHHTENTESKRVPHVKKAASSAPGIITESPPPQEELLVQLKLREKLDPPLTPTEERFDRWIRFAHSPLVQQTGVRFLMMTLFGIVLPVLIAFINDWHTLCEPKNDCEPRNFWMNLDIQILTGLFTVKAIICFPWRLWALLHVLQIGPGGDSSSTSWLRRTISHHFPKRSHALGRGLHGLEATDDIDRLFFHIPHRPRLFICLLNLGDCLFQFVNQGTRVYFYTYALANSRPGSQWVDTFWPGAFVCGFAGGNLYERWINRVKRQQQQPEALKEEQQKQPKSPSAIAKFYQQHGPNPVDMLKALYHNVRMAATSPRSSIGATILEKNWWNGITIRKRNGSDDSLCNLCNGSFTFCCLI